MLARRWLCSGDEWKGASTEDGDTKGRVRGGGVKLVFTGGSCDNGNNTALCGGKFIAQSLSGVDPRVFSLGHATLEAAHTPRRPFWFPRTLPEIPGSRWCDLGVNDQQSAGPEEALERLESVQASVGWEKTKNRVPSPDVFPPEVPDGGTKSRSEPPPPSSSSYRPLRPASRDLSTPLACGAFKGTGSRT